MNNLNQDLVRKIEFYSIFINNVFFLLGILFFGWSLFDTLFLFWLELPAALLLLAYVNLVVPIKYGYPGSHLKPAYQSVLKRFIGLSLYTIIGLICSLWALMHIGATEVLPIKEGLGVALLALPAYLWKADMAFLTLLFLGMYLLPPFILERKGIKPLIEHLSLQTRIMVHPTQFVAAFVYVSLLFCLSYWFSNVYVLIGVLILLKSVVDFFIFKRLSF